MGSFSPSFIHAPADYKCRKNIFHPHASTRIVISTLSIPLYELSPGTQDIIPRTRYKKIYVYKMEIFRFQTVLEYINGGNPIITMLYRPRCVRMTSKRVIQQLKWPPSSVYCRGGVEKGKNKNIYSFVVKKYKYNDGFVGTWHSKHDAIERDRSPVLSTMLRGQMIDQLNDIISFQHCILYIVYTSLHTFVNELHTKIITHVTRISLYR